MSGMRRVKIGCLVVLASWFLVQGVQAEEETTAPAEQEHALPEEVGEDSLAEEETILEEGEEGEITERGIRRFKIRPPKPPRKRITIPNRSRNPRSSSGVRDSLRSPKNNPTQNPGVRRGRKPSVPPSTSQCVIKTSDIIDPRIENGDRGDGNTTKGAQESLMRVMQHGSVADRRAASSIIKALKSGRLAGVQAPEFGRKAAADRAARIPPVGTRGYWTLLKPGEAGKCLREPAGAPPMLLYRQKNMPEGGVEHTLVTKWAQCGLPTVPSPCKYVVDRHKPPPPSTSTAQGGLNVFVYEGKGLPNPVGPLAHVVVNVAGEDFDNIKNTGSNGVALFESLKPGDYIVRVDGNGVGFNRAVRQIRVEGARTSLSVKLQKGESGRGSTECPAGTTPHADGVTCIVQKQSGHEKCTPAQMAKAFDMHSFVCESIRHGLLASCLTGNDPCEGGGGSFSDICELNEGVPGTTPGSNICQGPTGRFQKKCVPAGIISAKKNGRLECNPGSGSEVRKKYQSWPGRLKYIE